MGGLLEVIDLRKDFIGVGEPVSALSGVSFQVNRGEFVVIMGASGSGKSTLLHLIAGLDAPTAGTVRVEGHDLSCLGDRERTLFRRRRLGIIFQAYHLLPTLTALENVMIPAMLDGADVGAAEDRARELLRKVDLSRRIRHRPQALSGGEQQRVAVARALINDPALILADEPTGNLDSRHGETVWRLLAALVREEGRTVTAVTHESYAARFADRIIKLKDGRIVPSEELGDDNDAPVAARGADVAG